MCRLVTYGVKLRNKMKTTNIEKLTDTLPNYQPCANGIHICGIKRLEDGYEVPYTVANFQTDDVASFRSLYEVKESECGDYVVDIMKDGDLIDDFTTNLQMIGAMKQNENND